MDPDVVGTGTIEAVRGALARSWVVAGAIIVSTFASIAAALRINKSRKTDAAKDREQRDRIADEDRKQRERAEARQAKDAAEDRKQRDRIADAQLAAATRQADIAAQAIADAAADRKQQAAIEERRAKEEDRRAKEAGGMLKALDELLHRTAPPSPPGVAEDKPDITASPNPDPGQDGADSMGAASAKGGNGQAAQVGIERDTRGDCGAHTDRRVPPPDQPAGNLEGGPKADDRHAG